jgi:Ser/Thr protein kinase RdoA (MazF antagonist)
MADAELSPLAGGYSNELFRAGELVVRVEGTPPESVAWEHGLVRFLSARIDEVVAPVETLDGSTFVGLDSGVVSVWPYVSGSQPRRRHAPHALAAAELLGRLHRAAADWEGGQRPGARPVEGPGARGPIHGDFYRANVLFRRGRAVGLIDWEESCVDLFAYELANAVWEFCKDKRRHDFDRDLAAAMVAAYDGPAERHGLVELICVRRRREIEDSNAREGRGEPVDLVYRRHNERSLSRLGG